MKNSDIKKIAAQLNLKVLKIDSSRYCTNTCLQDASNSVERKDLHLIQRALFLKKCNVLRFTKAKIITVENERKETLKFWIYANSSISDFKNSLKSNCWNYFVNDTRFVKTDILRSFN